MVQIFIKMSSGTSCPEWTVIELQGDLEMRHPVPLEGTFIGDLHFTTNEQPVLIIGHHILYGKKMQLEKPFAVLTRSHDKPSEQTDNSASKTAEYDVKAVIKTKLLFKTRPKPILAHVPKKI